MSGSQSSRATTWRRRTLWIGVAAGELPLVVGTWVGIGELGAPTWVKVVAACAVAVALPVPAVLEARERRTFDEAARHATLQQHLRFWDGPEARLLTVSEADPLRLGVTPSSVSVTRSRAAALPPYVPRREDAEIEEALTTSPFVLLVGESKSGKSRAAFEAARRLYPSRNVVVPEQPESLSEVLALDPPIELEEAVIWLDNLEAYLRPDGLTLKVLETLDRRAQPTTVLATIASREHDAFGPAGDIARPIQDVLRRARSIRLRPVKDVEAVQDALPDVRVEALEGVRRFGLGAFLVAGADLVDRYENAANAWGVAIVRAAADWRRAGMARPVPEAELRRLYQLYLPEGAEDTAADFDEGLGWAREEIYASAALLVLRDRTPVRTFEVFDYLVDYIEAQEEELPAAAWQSIIAGAEAEELLIVGVMAYARAELVAAEAAFERAAAAGLDEAMVNLSLLSSERGEEATAAKWRRRARPAKQRSREGPAGVPFVLNVERLSDSTYVVAVVGDVDLYVAETFKQQLLEVISQGAHNIVMDMTDTTFLDSTTLGVIVGGYKRLRDRDGQLVLVCTDPMIRRVFTTTGLARFLTLFETVDDALDYVRLGPARS